MSDPLTVLEEIDRLCHDYECSFSLISAWTDDEDFQLVYEWQTEGPRGFNNYSATYPTALDALNGCLEWLRSKATARARY